MKTVLIIDDEPVVRALVQASLAGSFEVASFADGESALEALRRAPADLVLLDLGLPGMSGMEVARRLRYEAATASIPILYLTGHDASRISGADGVLQKPFTPESLRNLVSAWLS